MIFGLSIGVPGVVVFHNDGDEDVSRMVKWKWKKFYLFPHKMLKCFRLGYKQRMGELMSRVKLLFLCLVPILIGLKRNLVINGGIH